jgi:cobalt-zinc-cadmium efflux system membrane fusion protein
MDWCKEHAIPESVCTRCNASLIANFKQAGDWCSQHGLPESQCVACHPELAAKFKAMEPKSAGGE